MVFFNFLSSKIKLSDLWNYDLNKIKGCHYGIFSNIISDEENYRVMIDTIKNINYIKGLKLERPYIHKEYVTVKGKGLKKLLELELPQEYKGIDKDKFSAGFKFLGPKLMLVLTGSIYEVSIIPSDGFLGKKDKEPIAGEKKEVKKSKWNLPFFKSGLLPFSSRARIIHLNELFDFNLSDLKKGYKRFSSYSTINDKWLIVEVGSTKVIAMGITIGFKLHKTITAKFDGNKNEKINDFNNLISRLFSISQEIIPNISKTEFMGLLFILSLKKLGTNDVQLNLESSDKSIPLEIRIIISVREQPIPILPRRR